MSEERIALVARTLDVIEMLGERLTGTWYEVRCGKCRTTFKIEADTLDKIITAYGYTYCANGLCASRLYAMPNEAVEDRAKRRAARDS